MQLQMLGEMISFSYSFYLAFVSLHLHEIWWAEFITQNLGFRIFAAQVNL